MSFVDELLETYKGVLTQPSEYFSNEERRDGFGYSLKFAAVNLIISGVLGSASILAFGAATAVYGEAASGIGMGILAAIVLVATPVLGLIGLMISSGLIHIFVHLLGGENGYSETLSVMEYATAVQPITSILSFIPLLGSLLNLLVGLYAVFLQGKGLENFQEMSFGKSLAAIVLPVIIVTVLVIGIVTVLFAGLLAGVNPQPA
jgi:hypothetical protein